MKKYVISAEGAIQKYDGAFDSKGEDLNKTVDTLSGNGKWHDWYGFKLFIDDEGTVIKGMEPFVGRRFADLNKLNQIEGLTVHNSIRNVLQSTNKSIIEETEKAYKENMDTISGWLDEKIALAKLNSNG